MSWASESIPHFCWNQFDMMIYYIFSEENIKFKAFLYPYHADTFCHVYGQLKIFNYHKVASSRLSELVAHLRIFRLFIKRKFDAYVL